MGVVKEKGESMETPQDRNGRRDTRFQEIPVTLGFHHIEFRSSMGHLARPTHDYITVLQSRKKFRLDKLQHRESSSDS